MERTIFITLILEIIIQFLDRLNRYWVEINGSEETASSSQYARGVTQYVWQGREDCHSVEHFRVQGGLHD